MVNYLYDVETIASNHEAFVNDGTVMRSADVDTLLAADPVSTPNQESRGVTTP
jgi:malonyl-CoA decarboxylase